MKILILFTVLFFCVNNSLLASTDSLFYFYGNVKKVELLRLEDVDKDKLWITSSCGLYRAHVEIKDIIYGEHEHKFITVMGLLSYDCRMNPELNTYIFGIDKESRYTDSIKGDYNVDYKKRIYSLGDEKIYPATIEVDNKLIEKIKYDIRDTIIINKCEYKELDTAERFWYKKIYEDDEVYYVLNFGVRYKKLKESIKKEIEREGGWPKK